MKISGSFSLHPSGLNRDYTAETNDVDNSLGLDGQVGFALSDHFLMELSAMHRNEADHFNDDDLGSSDNGSLVKYRRSLFSLGLGYYTPMSASGKNYFNIVVDGGIGRMLSYDNSNPYNFSRFRVYEARLLKLSLKPAFNFFFNDAFRMSFAPRFALLKLNNIGTTYTLTEEQTLGYHTARDKFLPMFEPSLHLQAGPPRAKWLKFDVGFNFATNPLVSNNTDKGTPVVTESYDLYSRGFLMTFGLSFYPFERR